MQVINSLEFGGAERLVVDLSIGLRNQGIDVAVAALQGKGAQLMHSLRDAGIPVMSSTAALYSPRQRAWLGEVTRGFDIVHTHLFPTQLWVASSSRLSCKDQPLVTTEHSTFNRRRRLPFRGIDQWLYRHYDAVISVTEGVQASLMRWVPTAIRNPIVIPNGVALDTFSNAVPIDRESLVSSRGSGPLIVSVGRLERVKDHATIVRAIKELTDAHLVVVGDGSERAALERLIADLGLTERVHLLGARSDVPRILKSCDLYVQASLHEGMSLAIVEAMAAGLPAVVSDSAWGDGLPPEAVITYPSGDSAALAGRIRHVLGSTDEYQRLQAIGTRQVRNFSIDTTVTHHVELYKRLRTVCRHLD